ncbi:chromate transport protein ChrA [Colletotrichum cuscutae]|uniref:Chromate transport protein ChrA n=1 Tax=Colletotrichum cuscutae TaxID=1209917 RepID=A0AAI9Y592_9PEZI|nr:chromate transport protein ChrA [Colletotrichum cuscutae]
MLYCINLIQDGLLGAILAFMIWSLPGALGMYGLSLGVSYIRSSLPRAVYALLSGLNAATVGIIAHAAVELSDKSILMCAAGCSAIVHDYRWIQKLVVRAREMMRALLGKRQGGSSTPTLQSVDVGGEIHLPSSRRTSTPQDRNAGHTAISPAILRPSPSEHQVASTSRAEQAPIAPPMEADARRSLAGSEPRIIPREFQLQFSWKTGAAIIATFFATFITVMAIRGMIPDPPVLYSLFSNLYLAGTIIFGGGPVVIPLLREYIVAEGWVSPRDFLIGLAIAQSFPGPNFNFAVFLSGLTVANAGHPASIGAAIAFAGIFTPGLVLVHGTMGVWGALRSRPWVKAMVRGVNASAVGLIYTAVYRIWQVGYLDEGFQSGRSLGDDPWWVVVTATALYQRSLIAAQEIILPPSSLANPLHSINSSSHDIMVLNVPVLIKIHRPSDNTVSSIFGIFMYAQSMANNWAELTNALNRSLPGVVGNLNAAAIGD